MITVKELKEKLNEFPEESDILVTFRGNIGGYSKLKEVSQIKTHDNEKEYITPLFVF